MLQQCANSRPVGAQWVQTKSYERVSCMENWKTHIFTSSLRRESSQIAIKIKICQKTLFAPVHSWLTTDIVHRTMRVAAVFFTFATVFVVQTSGQVRFPGAGADGGSRDGRRQQVKPSKIKSPLHRVWVKLGGLRKQVTFLIQMLYFLRPK